MSYAGIVGYVVMTIITVAVVLLLFILSYCEGKLSVECVYYDRDRLEYSILACIPILALAFFWLWVGVPDRVVLTGVGVIVCGMWGTFKLTQSFELHKLYRSM